MPKTKPAGLSRRERQIMDIVYRLGQATPAQVREALPDPPSYTAVNTLLRILMDNGHLNRTQEGRRFAYFPAQPRQNALRSAVTQMVNTFFGGSVERAVTTMLSEAETTLTETELENLAAMIARFKAKETEGNA